MGVMACYRTGCKNILCDRYSSEYGYICNYCFEELCESGTLDIQNFMHNVKPSHKPARETYEEIFPSH